MRKEDFFEAISEMDDDIVAGAAAVAKRRVSWKVWGAMAACIAVAVLAIPVYRLLTPPAPTHSFVTAESGNIATATTTDTGGMGDRDEKMTVEDLRREMAAIGFSEEDIEAYTAEHLLTWAYWWKFVGKFEGKTPTLEDLIEFVERAHPPFGTEAPNTGALPGGAYIGEADPASQQEAADAYQRLMEYFRANYAAGLYPEWYGGAYIDPSGALVVNLVMSGMEAVDEKELCIQIMEWAGSQRMVFSDVKYSLGYLYELQSKVTALPELLKLSSWACGVDEKAGVVELTIPEADEALLVALAKLDPDDDAIRVVAGETIAVD